MKLPWLAKVYWVEPVSQHLKTNRWILRIYFKEVTILSLHFNTEHRISMSKWWIWVWCPEILYLLMDSLKRPNMSRQEIKCPLGILIPKYCCVSKRVLRTRSLRNAISSRKKIATKEIKEFRKRIRIVLNFDTTQAAKMKEHQWFIKKHNELIKKVSLY